MEILYRGQTTRGAPSARQTRLTGINPAYRCRRTWRFSLPQTSRNFLSLKNENSSPKEETLGR
jgi:hypothetical protein